jgi:hypothetical protein
VVVAIRCIKNNKASLNSIFTGKSQPEVLQYMARFLAKECDVS